MMFADSVILFVENPKKIPQKVLLELINEFGKVMGHKISAFF